MVALQRDSGYHFLATMVVPKNLDYSCGGRIRQRGTPRDPFGHSSPDQTRVVAGVLATSILRTFHFGFDTEEGVFRLLPVSLLAVATDCCQKNY